MWGNLGISLFGPLTGALIATTTGSVGLAILAIVVGCSLGALLLGASAIFGATTGAPAMVSLRGLLGRRGSVVPTILNIGQNVGWATMEIIVISTAAVAVVGEAWRWPFVLVAGSTTNGVMFQQRSATGGTTAKVTPNVTGKGVPIWLKLSRTGSTVTATYSTDGTNWSSLGTATLTTPTVRLGFAVTSHNTSASTTASLSSITFVE